MNDFLLKKEKKNKKIATMSLPIEGFHLKPNLGNHKNLIPIKEMILVEDKIKNQMIIKQFNRTFRRLIKMILDVTESENATASDCAIALNEVSKTMSILERKYQKDLKKKEYMHLQKKLLMLESKLKEKIILIRNNEIQMQQIYYQQELTEEKGKSR